MIHLSYNGELYSYDNKTTTTVSPVTNIPITIHPYVDIEGAKLYYKQNDTEGIVDITNNVTNIPGAYLVTGDLQVALKLASGVMSNTFTLGVTVISSSGDIMDDDIRFTMDNKKRLILVPGHQTLLAIQFDNQSEIVTFKFPRYQEGVDLSTKVPYVNYKRPQVEDLGKSLCTIEETTEDTIYITWMIDATVTQYDGVIQFQVEFADSGGYRWQSQIGEIPILASLYNTGLEPYTPGVLEQYIRIIMTTEEEAEAWATGEQHGIPVLETHPAYHNNAKYYAEHFLDSVDSSLSNNSTNPVQNRVIKAALDLKADDKVFIAVYGVTDAETIEAKYQSGKVILCQKDLCIYPLISREPTTPTGWFTDFVFGGFSSNNVYTTLSVRTNEGTEEQTWGFINTNHRESIIPIMDGTAGAGSSGAYARADHVHPRDTSRLAANQGVINAGKFLVVGNDGVVVPVTMAAWQGGSY